MPVVLKILITYITAPTYVVHCTGGVRTIMFSLCKALKTLRTQCLRYYVFFLF